MAVKETYLSRKIVTDEVLIPTGIIIVNRDRGIDSGYLNDNFLKICQFNNF